MAVKQEVQTASGEAVYFQTSSDMVIDEETGNTVKEDIDDLTASVNALNEDTTVQDAIDGLSTKVDTVKTTIDDLSTKVEELSGSGTQVLAYVLDKSKIFDIEPSTLPYSYFYGGNAVVYNDEIHLLGTTGTYGHYKWDGSSWTSVSTLPYSFISSSAVVYDGCIHILGSGSSGNYTKHYKYDGTSWTSVSTLPYNFYDGSAVVYNNEIHILGSSNSNTTYTNHYKYDGTSWTSVSTLPYEFDDGSAVVYNNEIHILGSVVNNTNYTSHYKYNGTVWTSVSTLPCNFYEGACTVYDNKIHIFGGVEISSSSSSYLNKHYAVGILPINMYLNKDTKIYSDELLSTMSNCHYDNDHIVVDSDGIVKMGACGCESILLTIVK